MRLFYLILGIAPLLWAQSGIAPPLIGQYRDTAGRLIRVQGLPGAMIATEVLSEGEDSAEFLAGGLEWMGETGAPAAIRDAASGLVWALPAVEASLGLFVQLDANTEDPVPDSYQFPPVAPGEELTLKFRLRNSGTASVTVTKLAMSGNGFLITQAFTLPRVIAPGFFADFVILYRPEVAGAHRATLQVNDKLYELRGDSKAYPRVEILESGNWTTLSPYRIQEIGSVQTAGRLERRLRIVLPEGVPPLSRPPSISGAAFRLAVAGLDYLIYFEPPAVGDYAGALTVETRTYALRGTATPFAPPLPVLSLRSTTLESGRQEKLSISLVESARTAAIGLLKMQFIPASPDLPDDASIAFLPARNRSAVFSVAEGATQASFGTSNELIMQTGATAGTILIQLTLGPHNEEIRINVAAAPVRFESARASRGSNLIQVDLSGIDNAHNAGKLIFRFFLRNGSMVAPGAIEADAGSAFRSYYASSPATAGTFALRAQFLVSGPVGDLAAVEVSLDNSSGRSEAGRLTF